MRIAGEGKKIDVTLQLSRTNQGFWCLDFEDEKSRLLISKVFIPDKEIVNLLSTRTATGTAELFLNENFGKSPEVKTVLLDLTYHEEGLFELKERIKLWESNHPEWKADEIKSINWQKRRDNDKYEVVVRRYV